MAFLESKNKGSIPVGRGGGEFGILAAGVDGDTPVADSNEATGLKYNAFPSGIWAARRRWWLIQQNGGLTTLNQAGFTTAPTITGTAVVLNLATAQFIQYTSAAVINSDAGWIAAAFSQTQFNYRPAYAVSMRVGTPITNVRYWLGLFSATPIAATDPAIDGMGFRYSTDVDGTAFWRCWTNDGAGGGTVTVTTVALTANTVYNLAIEVDSAGANVKFYINGILVATHTTNLPTGATNLGHVERLRTLDAVAKLISLSKVYCEQRAV